MKMTKGYMKRGMGLVMTLLLISCGSGDRIERMVQVDSDGGAQPTEEVGDQNQGSDQDQGEGVDIDLGTDDFQKFSPEIDLGSPGSLPDQQPWPDGSGLKPDRDMFVDEGTSSSPTTGPTGGSVGTNGNQGGATTHGSTTGGPVPTATSTGSPPTGGSTTTGTTTTGTTTGGTTTSPITPPIVVSPPAGPSPAGPSPAGPSPAGPGPAGSAATPVTPVSSGPTLSPGTTVVTNLPSTPLVVNNTGTTPVTTVSTSGSGSTPAPVPTPTNITPPQVSLSALPTTGQAPLQVTFSAQASNVQVQNYAWHIGTGAQLFSNQSTASHTFNREGRYVVTLRVTDQQNHTFTLNQEIVVTAPASQFSFTGAPALSDQCTLTQGFSASVARQPITSCSANSLTVPGTCDANQSSIQVDLRSANPQFDSFTLYARAENSFGETWGNRHYSFVDRSNDEDFPPLPEQAPQAGMEVMKVNNTSGCDGNCERKDNALRGSLAVGKGHSCVLMDGGDVSCWGNNSSRQVIGEPGDAIVIVDEPTLVTGVSNIKQIAVGDVQSCALREDGRVFCWGDTYNSNATSGSRYFFYDAPTQIALGNPPATALAIGREHSCALMEGGTVQCWGWNENGQLGNPDHRSRSLGEGSRTNLAANLPRIVIFAPNPLRQLTGVSAIAAGDDHTCAIAGRDNEVYCWGKNDKQQLGDRSTDLRDTNSVVPIRVEGARDAVQLVAGSNHSCALIDDGTVQCWGDNRTGQLGFYTRLGQVSSLTERHFGQVTELDSPVLALAAGGLHTCALLNDGRVKCWGNNTHDQLGRGADSRYSGVGINHTPEPVVNLTDVRAIEAGEHHTCALLSLGEVQCWGRNDQGQIGNATVDATNRYHTPTSWVINGHSGSTLGAAKPPCMKKEVQFYNIAQEIIIPAARAAVPEGLSSDANTRWRRPY